MIFLSSWTEQNLLPLLHSATRTHTCIRRPQYICKLLWWHAKASKQEHLSLGQIAARVSNGKQIKVTIIFVDLLCCWWPLLNGACKRGDRWILPHQPRQKWCIFGSHRNARTEKNPNPTTKPISKKHGHVLFVLWFSRGKNTRKKLFRVWGGDEEQQTWSGEMRGRYDHTPPKREIQRECRWELLPLFNQNGRGRGEGALAGCVALHRLLLKSRIHWGKDTLGRSSVTASASEENII